MTIDFNKLTIPTARNFDENEMRIGCNFYAIKASPTTNYLCGIKLIITQKNNIMTRDFNKWAIQIVWNFDENEMRIGCNFYAIKASPTTNYLCNIKKQ